MPADVQVGRLVCDVTAGHPCGKKRNPVLRDFFLYHCEIKHLILAFLLFILRLEETASCYIFMSTQFVLMDSLEHHTLPRAHSHFHSQGPPVRLPACLSIGITFRMIQPLSSQALNKQSSSFILYHFEACQTLNRQLCGSGYYFFLVTSLYSRVSSTD